MNPKFENVFARWATRPDRGVSQKHVGRMFSRQPFGSPGQPASAKPRTAPRASNADVVVISWVLEPPKSASE